MSLSDHGKRLKEELQKLHDSMLKLQQALRTHEVKQAQFNHDKLWEVYQTDADLDMGKLIYQGFHRDVAESVLDKAFKAAGGEKDFMLYDTVKREIVMTMLSPKTKTLRGECQG